MEQAENTTKRESYPALFVLIVGATDTFGARLTAHLAREPGLRLILAARREAPLRELAASIEAGAQAILSTVGQPVWLFDRRKWTLRLPTMRLPSLTELPLRSP